MTTQIQELEILRALAEIELQRRETGGVSRAYASFRDKYWNDPVGFVRDCIMFDPGQAPTDYQCEIMQAVVDKRRVCVRGPHGLGKTALTSWLVLWFALTRDGKTDWKCPTTASSWRQLEDYLWPEIHKWSQRIRWDKVGRKPFDYNTELMQLNLRLRTGRAFAMATKNPELIEGAHSEELLYVFDEAKAIPSKLWDAAEGAFSVGNCRWIAVSTPGEPQGRFYDIHRRAAGYDDWTVIHVSKEQCIAAGRFSAEWAQARAEQWGRTSSVYLNRVEGQFAASTTNGIPLADIEAAIERWHAMSRNGMLGKPIAIGVDVGTGHDPSVIAEISRDAVLSLETAASGTMELVAEISRYLRNHRDTVAVIDGNGIGVGVVERLAEFPDLEGRVIVFRGNERNTIRMGNELSFANKRSGAWWYMRKRITSGTLAIPDHRRLVEDLTSIGWHETSNGRLLATPKEKIRMILGRSTDYGDALAMALSAVAEEDMAIELSPMFSFDYRG